MQKDQAHDVVIHPYAGVARGVTLNSPLYYKQAAGSWHQNPDVQAADAFNVVLREVMAD